MLAMRTYRLLVRMTINKAIICRRFDLTVRFMTVLAADTAHGTFLRNFLMAVQAFLFCRHSGNFTIRVTLETREALHPHPVHPFVFMAVQAVFFFRRKIMHLGYMAFMAFYFFHEHMPGVSIGFPHGHRALFYWFQMADSTAFPGSFPAVLLGDLALFPGIDICKKKPVLTQKVHWVADLTIYIAVRAVFPRPVRLFHNVAEFAELRVAFSELLVLVYRKNREHHHNKHQNHDQRLIRFQVPDDKFD
jgi:hypothetical protein